MRNFKFGLSYGNEFLKLFELARAKLRELLILRKVANMFYTSLA